MNTMASNRGSRPSAAVRAEAAAWIARLHGPNRTPEVEAGFRRWISEDPQRAAAFELLTDTWEKATRLRRRPIEEVVSWERPGFRISFSRAALAGAAVTAFAVIGTVLFLQGSGITTGIGEQRTLALEDGSRVYLNTNTQAIVQYDKDARRIELKRGEALFEVTKRPNWPFIVTAGDRQVRALGTSFIIRRDQENLAITLVEGRVTVTPITSIEDQSPSSRRTRGSSESDQAEPSKPSSELSAEDSALILRPGQRLTFTGGRAPQLDTPPIDRVTAWQRGQVALDNTPLADAVGEMNRYSRVRLIIEDPSIAAIPVSGIFRAGDSEDFAHAVAKTYQLTVIDGRNEIVLTKLAN